MPNRNEAHARQDRALAMRQAGAAWSVITETLGFAEGGGGAAAAVRSAERRRDAANTNGFIYTREGRNTEYALRQQAQRAAQVAAEREAMRATMPRVATPAAPRRTTLGRTFGIEAEFVGNAYATVAALAAVGITCVDNTGNYNHQTLRTWKIVTDGSVHSTTSRGRGGQGLELVSPVLQGAAGLAEVKKALDAVRNAGGIVNRTCGLHVHVGMDGLNGAHIAKVIDLYRVNEPTINQLVAPTRRGSNTYCRLLSGRSGDNYANLRRLNFVSNDRINPDIASFSRGFGQRYYTVNVCAYSRYGTLEFRQHQGTLVGNKAVTWVKFVLAMVEKAVTMDDATVTTTNVGELADLVGVNRAMKTRMMVRAQRLAGVRASRDANE